MQWQDLGHRPGSGVQTRLVLSEGNCEHFEFETCSSKISYIIQQWQDSGFMVTKPNGELFMFIQSKTGLHYLDTVTHSGENMHKASNGNIFVVNTVTTKPTTLRMTI